MLDSIVIACAIMLIGESYHGGDGMSQSKIDELERLLNSEEDTPIQILPNGEIREIGRATVADMGNKKPLTMKENLGGEY